MTPVEVLRRAKALIEERGWWRGFYADRESGAVCVRGACMLAGSTDVDFFSDDGWETSPESDQAEAWLSRALGVPNAERVAAWNDAPTTTRIDVLRLLDKAITLAEQEASQ
jgi:hypothetical protein